MLFLAISAAVIFRVFMNTQKMPTVWIQLISDDESPSLRARWTLPFFLCCNCMTILFRLYVYTLGLPLLIFCLKLSTMSSLWFYCSVIQHPVFEDGRNNRPEWEKVQDSRYSQQWKVGLKLESILKRRYPSCVATKQRSSIIIFRKSHSFMSIKTKVPVVIALLVCPDHVATATADVNSFH